MSMFRSISSSRSSSLSRAREQEGGIVMRAFIWNVTALVQEAVEASVSRSSMLKNFHHSLNYFTRRFY